MLAEVCNWTSVLIGSTFATWKNAVGIRSTTKAAEIATRRGASSSTKGGAITKVPSTSTRAHQPTPKAAVAVPLKLSLRPDSFPINLCISLPELDLFSRAPKGECDERGEVCALEVCWVFTVAIIMSRLRQPPKFGTERLAALSASSNILAMHRM